MDYFRLWIRSAVGLAWKSDVDRESHKPRISPVTNADAWLAAICILVAAHAVSLLSLSTRASGPFLSDCFQLALGGVYLAASIQASYRSAGSIGRDFWRLVSIAVGLWLLAQVLGAYNDFFSQGPLTTFIDAIFLFSTIPFAIAPFLGPDDAANRFDRIHILDFVQAVLFWVAVYLYFPQPRGQDTALVYSGWERAMAIDIVLTVTFLVRAGGTNSKVVRALFGRMGLFLACTSMADA
jgi:hypothetical protein